MLLGSVYMGHDCLLRDKRHLQEEDLMHNACCSYMGASTFKVKSTHARSGPSSMLRLHGFRFMTEGTSIFCKQSI